MHGAFPLGVIVAAPLTGLGRDAGWTVLQMLAVVSVLACVPAVLLSRTARAHVDRASGQQRQPSRMDSIVPILQQRSLRVATTLIIVFLFLEHAVEQWSALHVEQTYASSASVSSLAPCLYMFTLFAGRMIVHRFEHRLGLPRLLQIGAIGTTVLLIGVACTGSLQVSLAAFSCMGLVMAPLVPGLYAWISQHTEERHRVRALSGVTALSYLGYLLSPLFFGGVSSSGGLSRAWLAMGVVSALAVAIVLMEGGRLARPVECAKRVG
jgi:fucose permease